MATFKSLLVAAIAFIVTANAAPQLESRQAVTVSNFVPMGCWSDDTGRRILKAITFTDAAMTVEKCTSFCNNSTPKYNLAGLENGDECWCSNAMDNGPSIIDSSKCSTVCVGNNLQSCGGPGTLINVFRQANIAATV